MIPKELLEKVRLIEIRARRLVDDVFSGQYESVFKGRGMEFEEVREYAPGDDIRTIDWNVTARMGALFVKKHREERELTVMLAVDVSGSLGFGSDVKLKSEVAAELSAILAFSAIRNNDRVGLLTFSDGPLNYIPPKKGKTHGMRVIREILSPSGDANGYPLDGDTHRTRLVFGHLRDLKGQMKLLAGHAMGKERYELKTRIGESLKYLNRILKRRSIIFLISDFISADEFAWDITLTSKRHDLTACVIRDSLEAEMRRSGIIALEDAETGQVTVLDTNNARFRKVFSEIRGREADALDLSLRSSKVEFVSIPTSGDYMTPLISLFQKRRKRLALGR